MDVKSDINHTFRDNLKPPNTKPCKYELWIMTRLEPRDNCWVPRKIEDTSIK